MLTLGFMPSPSGNRSKEKTMLTIDQNPDLNDTDHPAALWPRRQYQQVELVYDKDWRTLWTYMKPIGVPCFNQDMVEELHHVFHELKRRESHVLHEDHWQPVNYCVIASRRKKVFNLGGNLALFINLIREKNRDALVEYAKLCVDAMYPRIKSYDCSTTTISLVQGDALGGGFEFALSSHIIVAEAGSKMGLPEIIFSLFPGMGAYSFLSRRIGMRKTEEMMLSGNTYRAEELADMGVVDIVAAPGEGENAVIELIRKKNRHLNGVRSIYECRNHSWPITFEELRDIAMLWVDAALRVSAKDLQMMTQLAMAQRSLHAKYQPSDGLTANPVSSLQTG